MTGNQSSAAWAQSVQFLTSRRCLHWSQTGWQMSFCNDGTDSYSRGVLPCTPISLQHQAKACSNCRYMGLGSEWNERWCVIMPRFPSVAAPANQQLTRSLLVIYKVSLPALQSSSTYIHMLLVTLQAGCYVKGCLQHVHSFLQLLSSLSAQAAAVQPCLAYSPAILNLFANRRIATLQHQVTSIHIGHLVHRCSVNALQRT